MEKQYKCIIKNEKFEVEYFEHSAPANCVLTEPNPTKSKIYKYEMSNGIETRLWTIGGKNMGFAIYFEDNILEEFEGYNMKTIAEYLNDVSDFSKKELQQLLIELDDEEKTKIEIELKGLLSKLEE
jgi:hypothetical protein